MNKKEAIKKTIKYFHYFKYSPTPEELFSYLPYKTTKKELLSILSSLPSYPNETYEAIIKKRKEISKRKLKHIQFVLKILSHISYLKFIGLSGSMGMMNAEEKDDIDVFIITAKNRLWTTRLIVLTILTLMEKRRKRTDVNVKNKVCTNLWFDESHLSIPQYKQNLYTAHEVLQMKPIIQKGDIYERFLDANTWVRNYFPNNEKMFESKTQNEISKPIRYNLYIRCINYFFVYPISCMLYLISSVFEVIAKNFQLYLINRHKTNEIITDTQLWFFPDDFEVKLRKEKLL